MIMNVMQMLWFIFYFFLYREVMRMRHGVPEIKMKGDLLKSYISYDLRWRVSWIRVSSTKVDMVCFSPVGFGV